MGRPAIVKPAGTGKNMQVDFFTVILICYGTGLAYIKMRIIARVPAFGAAPGFFSFFAIACF